MIKARQERLHGRRAWWAALTAVLLWMAGSAHADAPTIEGVWKSATPRTLLTPINGSIPFTKQGRLRYDANKRAAAKGDYRFDPTMSNCASPGQPRLMLTPEPFAILQQPRMIMLVYQWNRLFRQISLGQPLKSTLRGEDWWEFRTKQGYAEGHWEGDTLIVKTVGLSGDKLLDNLLPNSDQLELTERIRLRDANTLEDRITITDPQMFSRSWEVVLTYARQPDSLLPFAEDVCLDRREAGLPPLPRQ